MSTKSRAQQVILAFWDSHQQERSYWHRDGVAAALREVVNQVLPHNPSQEFTAWKQEVLKIADEISAKNLY